jgi:hypothetical protein
MDLLTQHSCLVFFVLSKENVISEPNKNTYFHAQKRGVLRKMKNCAFFGWKSFHFEANRVML